MIQALICSASIPVGLQDSWSNGRGTNRVREEGGKPPGSLQVSVRAQLPQVLLGGGVGVCMTPKHLSPWVAAAFPIGLSFRGLCGACSGNGAGAGEARETWKGEGRPGLRLDRLVSGGRREVGIAWESPKGREC